MNVRLMNQREVDAEMRTYFRQQAEEKAALRAALYKDQNTPRPPENLEKVALSQEDLKTEQLILAALDSLSKPDSTPAPMLMLMASVEAEKSATGLSEAPSCEPSPVEVPLSKVLPLSIEAGLPAALDTPELKLAPAPTASLVEEERAGVPEPVAASEPTMPIEIPEVPVFLEAMPPATTVATATKGSKLPLFAQFPVATAKDVGEISEPRQEMSALCAELLIHNDYALVRDRYCHLSIRMNLMGLLAPAYRPALKTGAKWGDAVHSAVFRDQVVIDLHWCSATKMAVMPNDAEHQALFSDAENFRFDLAFLIAGKKWGKAYRAGESLCLTPHQQCQMLTLIGPEQTAKLKALNANWRGPKGKSVGRFAQAKCLIGQWGERDKRIAPMRHEYEMLWLALELLGSEASIQSIANLHALMIGQSVRDRGTIRDKLKAMAKNVALI